MEVRRAMPRPESPQSFEDMAQYTEWQMTCIMKPFADHVRQIMECNRSLSERLDRADAQQEHHSERLADVSKWVQQVKGSLNAQQAHLTALQNTARRLDEEKASLKSGHEDARLAIEQLDEQLRTLEGPLMEHQKELATKGEQIAQLRTDLTSTQEQLAAGIEPELSRAVTGLKELDGRHQRTVDELARARSGLDETTRSFKDFQQGQARQHQDSQTTLGGINGALKRLKTSLDETDAGVAQLRGDLSGNTTNLAAAQASIAKLIPAHGALQHKLEDQGKTLLNVKVRVEPLEKGLCQLLEAANRPVKNGSGGRRNVAEFIQELEELTLENKKSIDDLRKKEDAQDAHVLQCHEKVQKQIQQVRGDLGQTDAALADLKASHNDALNTIGSSMKAHDDTKAEFQSHAQKLDGLRNDLGGLRNQLSATEDGMVKVGTSLEFFNDTFSGLRKGFRNANARMVGGDDSLLPDPSMMKSTTPVLPNMRNTKSTTPTLPRDIRSTTPTMVTSAWGPREDLNTAPATARGSPVNPVVLATSKGEGRSVRMMQSQRQEAPPVGSARYQLDHHRS